MSIKEFDLISKQRRSQEEQNIVELPELVYAKSLQEYNRYEKTGEQEEYGWSGVFLKNINEAYDENLLSFVEFTLHKDEFKSKAFQIHQSSKIFNDEGLLILPKYQYDYPLEDEYSKKLINILLDYLYQTKLKDHKHYENGGYYNVDPYTKALLKTFMSEYAAREIVKHRIKDENGEAAEYDAYGFEGYPTILFASTRDIIIMTTVRPINSFLFDDSIDDLERIFDVTIGFFANTRKIYEYDYKNLMNQFRSFAMFIYQRELENNIQDSIGEASLISRYWYTEGLRNITEMQEKLNNSTDSFAFSELFVQEILNAQIEGVKNIEIYPFDRCFVFKDSALIQSKDDKSGRMYSEENTPIQTCESLLLKKSASEDANIKQRNNYVYEWERFNYDIKDFDIDYSKKIIEPHDWAVKKDHFLQEGYQSSLDFTESQAKAIDFMLYNLICQRATTKQVLELEKEYFSNEDGLCYIYIKNVDLSSMPTLIHLQDDYLRTKYSQSISRENTRNAKVVFMSYDPSRVKAKNTNVNIEQSHAFSILIVADADIQKSVMEIQSEKEDLKTALKLIVRQKTEAAELVKLERDKQKVFISNQLRLTMHDIKGKIQDHDVKDQLDNLLDEFDIKLMNDNLALKTIVIDQANQKERFRYLFEEITRNKFQKEEKNPWNQIVREIKDDNFLFNNKMDIQGALDLIVYESFLPAFSIRLDEITLQDAFYVILKNTVEEVVTTQERLIAMQVYVSYGDKDKAYLNVQLINSCNRISSERLEAMNNSTDRIGKNANKAGSTGLGIASTRAQLTSRFGEEATIKFRLLTPHQISTTLTMPVMLMQNTDIAAEPAELYEMNRAAEGQQVIAQQEIHRVIYLEDEEVNYKDSCSYLDLVIQGNYHHTTYSGKISDWESAEVLFTDIRVPFAEDGTPNETNGYYAIVEFFERTPGRTTFILSNFRPEEIRTALLETSRDSEDNITGVSISEEDIVQLDQNPIEKGKIYIANNEKSIANLVQTYPAVEVFIKEYGPPVVKEIEHPLPMSNIRSEYCEIASAERFVQVLEEITNDNKAAVYCLKGIEQDQVSEVFDLWSGKRIFIPEFRAKVRLSNPDIIQSRLFVQLTDHSSINYLDTVLFGLKNNFVLLPSTDMNIIQKCVDLALDYHGRISLSSSGILSALNHDLAKYKDSDIQKLRERIVSTKAYARLKTSKIETLLQGDKNEDREEWLVIEDIYRSLKLYLQKNEDAVLKKHAENLAFCMAICRAVQGGE